MDLWELYHGLWFVWDLFPPVVVNLSVLHSGEFCSVKVSVDFAAVVSGETGSSFHP